MLDTALETCKVFWGVSYSPADEKIVIPKGFIFPAYPDITKIISLEEIHVTDIEGFIDAYRPYFSQKIFLGLWKSPWDTIYIDAVQVCDTEQEARKCIEEIRKSSQRKIESMYDTENNREIFL